MSKGKGYKKQLNVFVTLVPNDKVYEIVTDTQDIGFKK